MFRLFTKIKLNTLNRWSAVLFDKTTSKQYTDFYSKWANYDNCCCGILPGQEKKKPHSFKKKECRSFQI